MPLPDEAHSPEEWVRLTRSLLQGAVLPGGLRYTLLRSLGVLEGLLRAAKPPPDGKRPLTKRQAEIYQFIVGHLDEEGYAPSYEEIAGVFGFHSLSTVWEHLNNLERKGWIRREYNTSRAITIVTEPDTSEMSRQVLAGERSIESVLHELTPPAERVHHEHGAEA